MDKDYNPSFYFWVPQYKYQVVSWLKERYPETNWNSHTKKACFKAYVEIRKRGEVEMDKGERIPIWKKVKFIETYTEEINLLFKQPDFFLKGFDQESCGKLVERAKKSLGYSYATNFKDILRPLYKVWLAIKHLR